MGKLNRKFQASNVQYLFLSGAQRTRLHGKSNKGKDIAFVRELFTKKDFERSVVFLRVCMNSRVCLILRILDFIACFLTAYLDVDFKGKSLYRA